MKHWKTGKKSAISLPPAFLSQLPSPHFLNYVCFERQKSKSERGQALILMARLSLSQLTWLCELDKCLALSVLHHLICQMRILIEATSSRIF